MGNDRLLQAPSQEGVRGWVTDLYIAVVIIALV